MSYLALTDEPPPYQNPTAHNTSTMTPLALLEDACAPYLRAGYKITSHNPDSFVLVRDRPPVNIVAALLLLPIPVLALLYVISARNRRDEVACIRVNSRGQIEESGDTLAALRAARSASRRSALVALVIILVLVSSLAAYVFGGALYSRIVGGNSGDDVAASGSTRASAATANDSILVVPPSSGGVATKRAKQRSKAADAYHPYVADPYPADDVPDSIEPVEPNTARSRKATKPDAARVVDDGDAPPPAKTNETLYQRSEVDVAAEVTSHAEPDYDPQDVPTSGLVQLEVVLRPDGTVTNIRVLKGLSPKLTSAAIKAARAITFKPARKDGTPVPMLMRLNYNFSTN